MGRIQRASQRARHGAPALGLRVFAFAQPVQQFTGFCASLFDIGKLADGSGCDAPDAAIGKATLEHDPKSLNQKDILRHRVL